MRLKKNDKWGPHVREKRKEIIIKKRHMESSYWLNGSSGRVTSVSFVFLFVSFLVYYIYKDIIQCSKKLINSKKIMF